MSQTPTLILARRAGSEKSRTETRVRAPSSHPATRAASIRKPFADPSGRVGGNASKNPQTRATKVNSEHHKVSESSSADAQRMRATNLPCHRQLTSRTDKPKFSGSGVNCFKSPIEYLGTESMPRETKLSFQVSTPNSWRRPSRSGSPSAQPHRDRSRSRSRERLASCANDLGEAHRRRSDHDRAHADARGRPDRVREEALKRSASDYMDHCVRPSSLSHR